MTLRILPLLVSTAWIAVLPAWGQILRCGNEYTNDLRQAELRSCQVVEGAQVSVPGTQVLRPERARPVAAAARVSAPPAEAPRSETRVDAAQQRARDADARLILEAELRKAEARLAQLQAEYNQGEPDKQGIEGRNHQRYLDRVQALRESLVRQQSDVTSLRRELARLPAGASTVASNP